MIIIFLFRVFLDPKRNYGTFCRWWKNSLQKLRISQRAFAICQQYGKSIRCYFNRLSCSIPFCSTHMGRARAWLRLALMQKKLADYLKVLIDHKDDALIEYFEPDALMLSDEAIVIIGLLVGLNVIDCNLCVKVSVYLCRASMHCNCILLSWVSWEIVK